MPSLRLRMLNMKSNTSSLVIISALKSSPARGSSVKLHILTYSSKNAPELYGDVRFALSACAIMLSAVVLPDPLPPESIVTGSNSRRVSPFCGNISNGYAVE